METVGFTLVWLCFSAAAVSSAQGNTAVTVNSSVSTQPIPSTSSTPLHAANTTSTTPDNFTGVPNDTNTTSLNSTMPPSEANTATNQNGTTTTSITPTSSSNEINQTTGSSNKTSSQSNGFIAANTTSGAENATASPDSLNVSETSYVTHSFINSSVTTMPVSSSTYNTSISENVTSSSPAPPTTMRNSTFEGNLNSTSAPSIDTSPTLNATFENVTTLSPVNVTLQNITSESVTTASTVNVTFERMTNFTTTSPVNITSERMTNFTTTSPVNITSERMTNFTTTSPANITSERMTNFTTTPSVNVTMDNLNNITGSDHFNMTGENVTTISPLFTEFNISSTETVTNITDSMTTANVTTLESTTTPYVPVNINTTLTFIFEGNCTQFFPNETLEQEYLTIFEQLLMESLNLNASNVMLGNISCQPNITVNVTIFGTSDLNINTQISRLMMNRTFSVTVRNETFNLYDIVIHMSTQITPEDVTTESFTTNTMSITTNPPITDSIFKFVFTGSCLVLFPELATETTTGSYAVTNVSTMNPVTHTGVNEKTTTSAAMEMTSLTTDAISTSSMPGVTNNMTSLNDSSTFNNTQTTATVNSTEIPQTTQQTTTQQTTTQIVGFYEEFANFSTVVQFQRTFRKILKSLVGFNLTENSIEISNVSCGSVVINLTVFNTTDNPDIDSAVRGLQSANFQITVRDSQGAYHRYMIQEVTLLSSPHMTISTTPSTTTVTRRPEQKDEGLNDVEIIVIIVFGVVGGVLLLLLIAFICYRCCTTRNTKSFSLTDARNNEVRLEDFTLTKMNRPTPIYTDQGILLPPAASAAGNTNRQGSAAAAPPSTKRTQPYGNPVYQGSNNGQYEQFRASASGSEPVNRQSTENLVPAGNKVHTSPGIENPSFSSDDILDSGSNTSTELPYEGSNGGQSKTNVTK